ncbi:MAG: alpha/beta hydrolase [Acidimicrobiales bacterium]
MECVKVGSIEISFRRQGRGPTLLLLHGAVSDSRVWRVELESFSDEFTVVAWDAPGCGQSSDAPEVFRMVDFADCLAGFIEATDLQPAHVLGHSWGTTLALELCRRRPSMIASLVLVGAYAGWAGSLPPDEVQRRLGFALAAADMVDANQWDPTSMPGLFSDAMPADRAAELVTIMSDIRPAATRTMANALAEADLRDALSHVAVPTLLINGDADERSPVDVAQQLHEAIPGSALTVLAGLGHGCYLESAAAFEAAIRPFLRNQAATDMTRPR